MRECAKDFPDDGSIVKSGFLVFRCAACAALRSVFASEKFFLKRDNFALSLPDFLEETESARGLGFCSELCSSDASCNETLDPELDEAPEECCRRTLFKFGEAGK
ncbi:MULTISPECIES: hypothetical protein [unclassified Undibacterium]|nr:MULTISPECIES: hypothetical protein [unclassified Undibacterium]MEB0140376.1 hypothetical protein [Undibacterium sp. CCC2.1]MEB0173410.1 hypothetical protein [Undibacterium sp. CCC1.1]MEB0177310.1 hypothetical protein [Undibacterium sp. CCC3.4]WPX43469.1 hypothetical protein RHM61_19190 [Undibacterium sp. CCC3.4]